MESSLSDSRKKKKEKTKEKNTMVVQGYKPTDLPIDLRGKISHTTWVSRDIKIKKE